MAKYSGVAHIGFGSTQARTAEGTLPASNPRFIPAIYNQRPVDAIYYGTVIFAVVDGNPRLRIFSNQEAEELKSEHNFIGLQPFYGFESKFTGFHYPNENTPVAVDGVVRLKLKVDATGNLEDMKVLSDEPPFLGFADAARSDFRDANRRALPRQRVDAPSATVTLSLA